MGGRHSGRRPPSPGLLTRRVLAERCGVHAITISKWERDGLPVAERGRRGKPSLYQEAAVRAWLAAREAAAAPVVGGLDPAQERAKKDRAQAMLARQMYRTRTGKLVDRDEVVLAGQTLMKGLQAQIRALPRRLVQAGVLEPAREAAAAALLRELQIEIARWTTLADAERAARASGDAAA